MGTASSSLCALSKSRLGAVTIVCADFMVFVDRSKLEILKVLFWVKWLGQF